MIDRLSVILPYLAPVIVTGIGLVLIFRATAVYLRLVYQLPSDQRPGSILERRLLGIPLFPPPLSWIMPGAFIVLQEAVLEDNHWARLVGGPVKLIVFDGVALYLESGDQFSRVVGPGNHLLGLHERIKEVIDLKPQMKTGYVKPWTKDGIRITLTLMAECQINASPAAQAASEDPEHPLRYPFDEIAVKRAVEHMTVKENGGELRQAAWLEGAWGSITGAINAYVARHTLDELFLAPPTPITNPAAYTGMIAQLLSDKFSAVIAG